MRRDAGRDARVGGALARRRRGLRRRARAGAAGWAPPTAVAARPLATPVAAPPAATPARTSPPAPREVRTGAYTLEVSALSAPGRAEHLRHVLAYRLPDPYVTPLAGTSGH